MFITRLWLTSKCWSTFLHPLNETVLLWPIFKAPFCNTRSMAVTGKTRWKWKKKNVLLIYSALLWVLFLLSSTQYHYQQLMLKTQVPLTWSLSLNPTLLHPSFHLSLNHEDRWGTTAALGLGELQACPFPDVVFPPLLLSVCLIRLTVTTVKSHRDTVHCSMWQHHQDNTSLNQCMGSISMPTMQAHRQLRWFHHRFHRPET